MQIEECHIPGQNTFLNPHFYSEVEEVLTRTGIVTSTVLLFDASFTRKGIIDNIWAMPSSNEIAGTVNYFQPPPLLDLKVHKIDNFFGSDFEFCVISFLVMLKY